MSDGEDGAFFGEGDVGEDLGGFAQEERVVVHACGVVADDEAFGLGLERDSGGLPCGGVHG